MDKIMVVDEKIKQDYIDALSQTLKNLEEQKEYIFEDMFERKISGIIIKINIEPGSVVNYTIEKAYHTIREEDEK